MATIIKEFVVDAPASKVWEALRDFKAVHEKLVPGFVTHLRMKGDDRIITFANGMTIKEVFVGSDDAAMRVAYSAVGELASHHNASAQVFDLGKGRSRFVWITDVLPNEVAKMIEPMMDQGAAVMKKTLEKK